MIWGIVVAPVVSGLILAASIYLSSIIPLSHDFNTLIMSEEGNLPVNLSDATSIDTI